MTYQVYYHILVFYHTFGKNMFLFKDKKFQQLSNSDENNSYLLFCHMMRTVQTKFLEKKNVCFNAWTP